MVKVKICGLSRPCDIDAVNEFRPDYVGFVFAESRRKVTPEQALKLRERLRPDIISVGVFVNEAAEVVAALSELFELIQLHGSEDGDYIRKIKALTGKPVIKANGGGSSPADYLLFDSARPGSGLTFDWSSVGRADRPFFLAGGLDITNVEAAIRKTKPFAVDVSSGVETNGFKDPAKIEEFIRRARNV